MRASRSTRTGVGGRQRAPRFDDLRPASEAASKAKRANRATDTGHEVLLRRALWRQGLRYRKHAKNLPGKPDLVFGRAKVVVFCDGDFWHGREWDALQEKLGKGSNSGYWLAKIARNRETDQLTSAALMELGWAVVRLWESDIKKDPEGAAQTVAQAVRQRLTDSDWQGKG